MDFDFFTAVDDFKPGDTAGSDMMGTVQFNSSCYYRYAVLDVDSFRANLDLDGEEGKLVAKSIEGLFRAGLRLRHSHGQAEQHGRRTTSRATCSRSCATAFIPSPLRTRS